MSRLVDGNPPHDPADDPIGGSARLPRRNERAECLSHAPFDGVVERDGFDGPRWLGRDARRNIMSPKPLRELSTHPGVRDLVSCRAPSGAAEPAWRAVQRQLSSEHAECGDRGRLEPRHLHEVDSEISADRGGAGLQPWWPPTGAVGPAPNEQLPVPRKHIAAPRDSGSALDYP